MADGQKGVMPDHSGTGKAHNRPDFFPHLRFVTMDPAIAAGRLSLLEGAAAEPQHGIIEQFATFAAKSPLSGAVLLAAVKRYHLFNGTAFPLHSPMHVFSRLKDYQRILPHSTLCSRKKN